MKAGIYLHKMKTARVELEESPLAHILLAPGHTQAHVLASLEATKLDTPSRKDYVCVCVFLHGRPRPINSDH